MSAAEPPIAVGRILGPWGVRGYLKVTSYSRSPDRFVSGTRVYAGQTPLVVETARKHKGHFVVKFTTVSSLGAAQALQGTELTSPFTELPDPPDGSYYQFQLIGLAAVTPSGEALGTVTRILETGANDVYLIERPDGSELLVPAISDVVKNVDLDAGRIVVDPPAGL
jgi:16S rRNA processing protein RimM